MAEDYETTGLHPYVPVAAEGQVSGLREAIQAFVADNNITCAETIYQTDRVIENACEFIEKLCDIVGYQEQADD